MIIQKIDETVNLVNSPTKHRCKKGMEMFQIYCRFFLSEDFQKQKLLLILKAKQSAGKEVIGMVSESRDERIHFWKISLKQSQNTSEMVMKRELALEEESKKESD